MEDILTSARDIELRFRLEGNFVGYALGQIWKEIFGRITMFRSNEDRDFGAWTDGSTIEVYDKAIDGVSSLSFILNMVHEFGHRFNAVTENATDMSPYDELGAAINSELLPERETVRLGMPGYPYEQSYSTTNNELSADMFVNWTYQSFSDTPEGTREQTWMNSQMPIWLGR